MASIYDKASLVLIPSGTKTSKVYSQKPTNGDGDFTFSRSTAATRVNASGNIEKETQNLLLQSNGFNTGSWGNVFSASPTGGESGYDGSNDAWLLSSVSGSASRVYQNTSSGVDVNSLSVYAKANTLTWARLQISTASGNYVSDFDLVNGVSGYTFNNPLPSIESVGNGWYRIKITAFDTSTQLRIYAATGNNDLSGAGSIYIQDAQLEQGLVARDYIETTTTAIYGGITDNVPRLDYTDSSCPALLLEPQRTNLVTNSEYFASSDYTSTALDSITLSSTISPEGVANAYEIVENTQNTIHRLLYYFNHSSGVTYSFSVFAKSGTGSRRLGILFGCGFGEDNAVFDLTTGEVTTQANGGTGSIVDMGNGWYKCTMTATANSNGTACAQIQMRDGNNEFYLGNGSNSILLYGTQLEVGSYATSYIPTYGSAVTRNADDASKTGISSLIGQTEGTLFAEFEFNANEGSKMLIFTSVSGAASSAIYSHTFSTNSITFQVWNGTNQVGIDFTGLVDGQNVKIAGAYKANDFVFYVNGTQAGSDTSGSVPSGLSQLEIGNYNEAGAPYVWNKTIKQALLFKTRLTNEELAALTTI